eukprot:11837228-Alexandrium_andersonii.AAC.1
MPHTPGANAVGLNAAAMLTGFSAVYINCFTTVQEMSSCATLLIKVRPAFAVQATYALSELSLLKLCAMSEVFAVGANKLPVSVCRLPAVTQTAKPSATTLTNTLITVGARS